MYLRIYVANHEKAQSLLMRASTLGPIVSNTMQTSEHGQSASQCFSIPSQSHGEFASCGVFAVDPEVLEVILKPL